MKNVSLLFSFFLLISLSLSSTEGNNEDNHGHKVAICHIPPGNPANAHTIIVSENAIPAHLAHGDALGVCDPCILNPDDPNCG